MWCVTGKWCYAKAAVISNPVFVLKPYSISIEWAKCVVQNIFNVNNKLESMKYLYCYDPNVVLKDLYLIFVNFTLSRLLLKSPSEIETQFYFTFHYICRRTFWSIFSLLQSENLSLLPTVKVSFFWLPDEVGSK